MMAVRTAMERVIRWSELTFHTDKEEKEKKGDNDENVSRKQLLSK